MKMKCKTTEIVSSKIDKILKKKTKMDVILMFKK